MRRLLRARNLWIALGLLLFNGLAWLGAASDADLVEVEPRLHPEIVAIREKLWSGEAAGEPFSIVLTEQMSAEGIAWFLARHPEVPFSHPQVEIDPQGVTGRGVAHVLGLRTPVHGRAGIALRDGTPVVTIQELGIAGATAPAFVLSAIQSEIEAQFDLSGRLPMYITRLELGEGTITVEGTFK